ncbi:MAG TPA: helix-turn-helix transcriptional regulator [Microbacterium sp.]|nr:helix-turn-helix transcriptional regulator [Microbacterium sp.]
MAAREPDLSLLRPLFNKRRSDAGFTYEQLAEVSGVSRQTLLNIASGKYNGDLRTWIKLAQAFNVTLDELLAPLFGEDID